GNRIPGALVLKQCVADGATQGFFDRLALDDGKLPPVCVFCSHPVASRNCCHKSSRRISVAVFLFLTAICTGSPELELSYIPHVSANPRYHSKKFRTPLT